MSDLSNSVADVVVALAVTALADVAVLVLAVDHPAVRVALLLPVVSFLPGYLLVSALYPDLPLGAARTEESERWSLTGLERVALSVVASLVIVPCVALVLNFTPFGIRPEPVLVAVSGLIGVLAVVAVVQRLRVDADERFRIPVASRLGDGVQRYFGLGERAFRQRRPFEAQTRRQRQFNLVLVGAVLLFASSVGYAAVGPAAPADDASFTESYLLSENESGALVAEGLPRNFSQGESRPIHVAIENHEGERTTYTTVVEVQRVTVSDGRARVRAQTELGRFRTTVASGETERVRRTITPALDGDRLRVVFLLYRGDPPATTTAANAYRTTRLWISVDGSGRSGIRGLGNATRDVAAARSVGGD